MTVHTIACPKCGAPLPPEEAPTVTRCPFCRAAVAIDPRAVSARAFRDALAEADRDPRYAAHERLSIGGVPYVLRGRLARGESSDVFLAERARPLTERVIVKVLRAPKDADLLEREWEILRSLQASTTQGAHHFTRLLPQPVALSHVAAASGPRPAMVLRFLPGFVHTFDDVRRAYPDGVDGRHAVWMWRRVLEILGFVHRSGRLHGAVLPQHLLVNARDHGVLVVGWSCAVRRDDLLPARCASRLVHYPEDVRNGAPASRATDLAMSARAIAYVLGGDPSTGEVPKIVPSSIAELVQRVARPDLDGETDDAWALKDRVGAAARAAYGPPAFHPFSMPGSS